MLQNILVSGGIIRDHLYKVSCLPQPYFEANVLGYSSHFGGRGANVAVMCAHLGIQTGLLAPVGNNFVSSGYKEFLTSFNIDLRGVFEVPDMKMPEVLIFTDTDNKQITFVSGVDEIYKDFQVPVLLLEEYSLVHVSSSGNPECNVSLVTSARESGCSVFFDVGNDPHVLDEGYLDRMIPNVDFLFLSDKEFQQIASEVGVKSPQDFLDTGIQSVSILNKDDRSATLYTSEGTVETPSLVKHCRDPTGASDAYCAGFLAALARGFTLSDCSVLGVIMSARAVENTGGQSIMGSWEELLSQYEKIAL
jgi:adenosine kinase